ncbi:hypothetical protein GCM10009768_23050 [Leucobacter iarius]|uniref:Uncharacterized protein n=1 Tax=Leucobacter iarius TaxID=333963 RepID=A0ABN2LM62_9MICO
MEWLAAGRPSVRPSKEIRVQKDDSGSAFLPNPDVLPNANPARTRGRSSRPSSASEICTDSDPPDGTDPKSRRSPRGGLCVSGDTTPEPSRRPSKEIRVQKDDSGAAFLPNPDVRPNANPARAQQKTAVT